MKSGLPDDTSVNLANKFQNQINICTSFTKGGFHPKSAVIQPARQKLYFPGQNFVFLFLQDNRLGLLDITSRVK